ncbi:MAG: hypothetical protein IID36_07795 [Planctomycetes bacterium]|nr:hypothetical protein [Planctomycetota bacterium]
MTDNVNILRNADFALGKTAPRNWLWDCDRRSTTWSRESHDDGPAVLTVSGEESAATGYFSQTVRCKPGLYYRVEATVSGDLRSADESGGIIIVVQPLLDDHPHGAPLVTPGVHRATEPIDIRAYFQAPDDVRTVSVSVGIATATGTARIHEVRFIEIIEPDEQSHMMAIPPPAVSVDVPRRVKTVAVCSETASTRPITQRLSECFGGRNVRTLAPSELSRVGVVADALLLPDARAPKAIRSLAALRNLAADRIVIISLPAFARLAGDAIKIRRIKQPDDPIHAKVVFGNFVTRGFALQDVFAYAWSDAKTGGFVQNQIRCSAQQKAFQERHGFATILASMCDQDATSDRPICLYKETGAGGLFVLDIEPAEGDASTFGEPGLAMHVLLNILDRNQVGLGQYVVPVENELRLRFTLREMAVRFSGFFVHDDDVPADEVTHQLVTVGGEDQMYGLPLKPKPVVLVRSGLSGGDAESVYGAFFWFKQLVRMAPHVCPYVQPLTSRFRFAWIPLAASWEQRTGFRRSNTPQQHPTSLDVEDNDLAVLIDVVSRPIERARVVIPRGDGPYARYVQWLDRIVSSFGLGSYFRFAVDPGEDFCDRDRFRWRADGAALEVVVDPGGFDDDVHRGAIAGGGQVVRIEVPGGDGDFAARSIERTDQAAMLLEYVIGLQYGLVAVNRRRRVVTLDGFAPVNPGEALIVEEADALLDFEAVRVG